MVQRGAWWKKIYNKSIYYTIRSVVNMKTNAELVYLRNRLVEQVMDYIDIYNTHEIKSHLTDLCNRISYTDGYNIDIACTETFYIRGKRFDDRPHIKIVEDEGFVVRIMKLDGILQCDFDHYDLMTDEQKREESEAEIEAERRMSLYNSGYRDF